jgi:hypothetical protein
VNFYAAKKRLTRRFFAVTLNQDRKMSGVAAYDFKNQN